MGGAPARLASRSLHACGLAHILRAHRAQGTAIITLTSQRNLLAHGIWLKDPIYDQWRVISWSGSWQISPGRGAKLKRKMAPEGVLFDLPELAELHETLLGILADIEAWIAEFAPPKA